MVAVGRENGAVELWVTWDVFGGFWWGFSGGFLWVFCGFSMWFSFSMAFSMGVLRCFLERELWVIPTYDRPSSSQGH